MELFARFLNKDTSEYLKNESPVEFTGNSTEQLKYNFNNDVNDAESVGKALCETVRTLINYDADMIIEMDVFITSPEEGIMRLTISKSGFVPAIKNSVPTEINDYLIEVLSEMTDSVGDMYLKALTSGLSASVSKMMKSMGVKSGGIASPSKMDKEDEIIEYINEETKGHVFKPNVTLDDYVGNSILKEELLEIKDFMERFKEYKDLNIEIPIGILFKGAPGTGKTYAAKCIAGSTDCYFISCTASSLQGMYIGSGSQNIRELFTAAKKLKEVSGKGVIIFIDEIDSLGSRDSHRGGAGGEEDRTVNQLLAEMNGFEDVEQIMVMAATNYADRLDDALLRSGRFSRQINIPYPEEQERKWLVEFYYSKLKTPLLDTNFDEIASLTYGLSPADIKEIANESAILTVRYKEKEIKLEYVNEAINKCITKNVRNVDKPYINIVTAHECGHVLAEKLYLDSISIKVTNYSYGDAGGFTQPNYRLDGIIPKERFIANVKVLLAGRAAEKVMCNTETNGASNDLQKAAKILTAYYDTYFFENYDVSKLEQLVNDKLAELYDEVVTDFQNPSNKDLLNNLINELQSKRVLYKTDLVSILETEGDIF